MPAIAGATDTTVGTEYMPTQTLDPGSPWGKIQNGGTATGARLMKPPSISFKGIPSEWLDWIRTNIERGCAPQGLVDILVANHFDPALSARAVAESSGRGGTALVSAAPRVGRIAKGNRFDVAGRVVPVVARMESPELLVLADFLDAAECAELVALSRAKLARSTVVDPASGDAAVIAARSSHGTYFAVAENPLVETLDRRVAAFTGIPMENGEGIQILRYGVGGEYRPHYDYFPETDPGSAAHLAKGGQRVATLIMYLNEVEAGGETIFPSLGNFKALPRMGHAVYFANCDDEGYPDPATLHGGEPVRAGEKWIAVKWLRQRIYGG